MWSAGQSLRQFSAPAKLLVKYLQKLFFIKVCKFKNLFFIGKQSESHDPYLACSFHPDGLILGACTGGNSNALRIWDVREQQNVATCAEHSSPVTCVSFSENGYLVATGSEDATAKIWDLRKLKCSATLEGTKDCGSVNSVAFDYSGGK